MSVESEALAVARTYADAEARILARITAAVAASLSAPDFERVALARLQRLRAEAVAELARVAPGVALDLQNAVASQYAGGAAAAFADIAGEVPAELAAATQVREGTRALARELAAGIGDVAGPVLRQVDDAFRSIVGSVVQTALARGISRRQAAQEALDRAFGEGLRFRDAGGRLWRLPDYTEMAARTGLAKATIAGHEAALSKAGLDLVVVQPGPRACSICDKWARSVLSRSGVTGTYSARNELTGGTIKVHVDATLAAARAAGFQHPNCRCRLRAYIPGVTKPEVLQRPPWDEEGYHAQQKQRGIERDIRKAKRVQALALDDDRAQLAKQSVVAQQKRLRTHLSEHPDLKRRSERERLTGRFGDPSERARAIRRPNAWTQPEAMPKVQLHDEREQRIAYGYTGTRYMDYNDRLRGHGSAVYDDEIATLTSVLERTSSRQKMLVARSVSPEALGLDRMDDFEQLAGRTFTEEGFMSTASGREGAPLTQAPWAGPGRINMRVTVPKGTPGANISDLSSFGTSEGEWLMPPGMQFEIVGVELDDSYNIWADAVIVGRRRRR